jgi:hypothetical protein
MRSPSSLMRAVRSYGSAINNVKWTRRDRHLRSAAPDYFLVSTGLDLVPFL